MYYISLHTIWVDTLRIHAFWEFFPSTTYQNYGATSTVWLPWKSISHNINSTTQLESCQTNAHLQTCEFASNSTSSFIVKQTYYEDDRSYSSSELSPMNKETLLKSELKRIAEPAPFKSLVYPDCFGTSQNWSFHQISPYQTLQDLQTLSYLLLTFVLVNNHAVWRTLMPTKQTLPPNRTWTTQQWPQNQVLWYHFWEIRSHIHS